MEVIKPSKIEIRDYIRHGLISVKLRGLEEGVVLLFPLIKGIPLDKFSELRPRIIWTKGDYQSENSNPRVVIASAKAYRRNCHKKNLVDGLIFEDWEDLPKGIEFSRGYRCVAGRIEISSWYDFT